MTRADHTRSNELHAQDYEEGEDIIQELLLMVPAGEDGRISDDQATEIGEMFANVERSHRLFNDLDDRPAHWGYRDDEGGWHHKLRQARNRNVDGVALFFDAAWGDQ